MYVFYGLKYILSLWFSKFKICSFFYVFHWTTIFHHYLILILYQFLYISLLISTLKVYSTAFSRFFISFFIWLYQYILLTLFLLKLIRHDYESLKALKIRTFKIFNLFIPSSSILSCFFLLFFLRIDSYFFIPAVITQISIIAAELVILIGMPIDWNNDSLSDHFLALYSLMCCLRGGRAFYSKTPLAWY